MRFVTVTQPLHGYTQIITFNLHQIATLRYTGYNDSYEVNMKNGDNFGLTKENYELLLKELTGVEDD